MVCLLATRRAALPAGQSTHTPPRPPPPPPPQLPYEQLRSLLDERSAELEVLRTRLEHTEAAAEAARQRATAHAAQQAAEIQRLLGCAGEGGGAAHAGGAAASSMQDQGRRPGSKMTLQRLAAEVCVCCVPLTAPAGAHDIATGLTQTHPFTGMLPRPLLLLLALPLPPSDLLHHALPTRCCLHSPLLSGQVQGCQTAAAARRHQGPGGQAGPAAQGPRGCVSVHDGRPR